MPSKNNKESKTIIRNNKPGIKKTYVSWKQIENLILKKVGEIKNVKDIFGIPRGGLIAAVILSHKLDLPLTNKITKQTLVVDEICDSGKTFIELEQKLGFKPKTFCIHKKSIAKYEPTYYC
ncbi:MAG: phosphoribosyltransferase [Candidatus Woesearchaeota archaeon]